MDKQILTDIALLAEKIAREENDPYFVHPNKKMLGLIEDLSSYYLNVDNDGRKVIRTFISEIKGGIQLPGLIYIVPSTIYAFIKSLGKKIHKKDDGNLLKIGLAAASIEEGRMDTRDLLVSIEELYKSAQAVGIDVIPHFKFMIDKSGSEGSKILSDFLQFRNK